MEDGQSERNEYVGSIFNNREILITKRILFYKVFQRDALAIDKAFLAMDTENAFEVVWNEIVIAGTDDPNEQSSINVIIEGKNSLENRILFICPFSET